MIDLRCRVPAYKQLYWENL